MRRIFSAIFALAIVAVCALESQAVILFDFEDQSNGSPSTVTSTQSGLTATVSSHLGTSVNVVGPLGPASWADHSLISFGSLGGGDGLVVDFSSAVSSAVFQFGDYNQDADTVFFFAYSGAGGGGTLLDLTVASYAASSNILNGDSDVGSISVAAAGINSVVIVSGGDFPGSLYFDNLSVDAGVAAVPEPATLSIWGLGALGCAVAAYRRKKLAA